MRWILVFSFLLGAAQCDRKSQNGHPRSSQIVTDLHWNNDNVQQHLKFFTAEPHPIGTARQTQIAAYLQSQAQSYELEVFEDSFTARVPDPELLQGRVSIMQSLTLDLPAKNIYARLNVPGSTCVILLGSHYDSKRLEGETSLGANDSGSSSAGLLELMRNLQTVKLRNRLSCSILAIWFDAEEAYLRDWQDGEYRHPAATKDHLYGSRHLANQLESCERGMCLPARWGGEQVQSMILLDMIGMPEIQLTDDQNSDVSLRRKAQLIDKNLFGGKLFKNSSTKPIEDDHIPFLAKGIPAIDLINFEDTSTWHSVLDREETLSLQSIREVSELAFLLVIPDTPSKEPL